MAGAHLEIQMHGTIAAGGSNARATVNTFHFRRSIIGAALTKANIDAAFQASYAVTIALALSARWTQGFNTVRFLDDATDPPVAFNHAAVGAIAGDSLPMTNTVYIQLKTLLKGKSYRGNKKYGPIAESDTTSGTDDLLNAGAIVRWQAAAVASFQTLVDSDGNNWVAEVLSKTLSQLRVNPTTVVANDVQSVRLRKSIGRLRKREAKSVY